MDIRCNKRVIGKVALLVIGIIIIMNALFLLKGLLGWYMVKSGLDEEVVSKTEIPRVSQYRLASHLGLAFIAYAGMFWSGLGQFLPRSQVCSCYCH